MAVNGRFCNLRGNASRSFVLLHAAEIAGCIAAIGSYNPAVNMNFRPVSVFIVSSLLVVANSVAAGIGLKQVAEGFVSPVILDSVPGSGRLLVGDQVGVIHLLSADGSVERPFFDLRDRLVKLNQGFDERGLLGLAFHPKFKENRKLYVYYSAPLREGAPADWNHTSHISEFKASQSDPLKVDPASERLLLQIDKPAFNHNCGRMAFGPDGFLYIGVGDGGDANDQGKGHAPEGNGQTTTTLLGKILRIDVDKDEKYGIPSDNPFADGVKGRPEIFAYGLRNPWGISFDRGGAHALFAADVGQDSYEEVNIITRGGNYGWNIREAFICFDPKKPKDPPADCPKAGADGQPLIDPIFAYKSFRKFTKDPESRGTSITGGYIYRGKALPQLQSKYVFADWSRNWVLPDGVLYVATAPANGGKIWSMAPLELTTHPKGEVKAYITALGEDLDGELYILTNGSNAIVGKRGKVFKLVAM
jgi:glucose/arabinose dehydrogenase